MRYLILGLGNSLLCDEGAGVHVIAYLQRHHADEAELHYLDGGTLSFDLAPEMQAADRLIVVDAAQLKADPGTVRLFEDGEMDRFLGQARRSVHEVGLLDLMDISRLLDALPQRRALVGIQPGNIDWGDQPTPAVAAAIPEAAAMVLGLVERWRRQEKEQAA